MLDYFDPGSRFVKAFCRGTRFFSGWPARLRVIYPKRYGAEAS